MCCRLSVIVVFSTMGAFIRKILQWNKNPGRLVEDYCNDDLLLSGLPIAAAPSSARDAASIAGVFPVPIIAIVSGPFSTLTTGFFGPVAMWVYNEALSILDGEGT
ncbi:hypothetical protein B0T16DRAFT_491491, partial [Cercophora newfieldiana]